MSSFHYRDKIALEFTAPAGSFNRIPTLEEMASLPDGAYYTFQPNNDALKRFAVGAKLVKNGQLIFTCPFCRSKYKKNGQPHAQARRELHYHGHTGLSNAGYQGHWSEHCIPHFREPHPGFHIFITTNTRFQ